jgi:CHAT domain-containing protein
MLTLYTELQLNLYSKIFPMRHRFKLIYRLCILLIAFVVVLPINSCKTPSILVTEEQRKGDELSNQYDYENAIVAYRSSLAASRKLGVYRNLEVEADICRKISYAFSAQGNYPEALEYAHYGLSRDSMLQNQLGIIEDCREIGKIHLYMGNFKQGIAFLDRVVILSDGLESSIKSTKLTSLADSYLTLSQVNSVLGKYSISETECNAALNIYKQLNNETGQMECLLQHGKISNETGKIWQAEVYVKRSEKLAVSLELNTTRHLHLLADMAEDKSDYQKAIELRLEAIEEAKRSNILPSIVWTTMVTGDTYGLLGDSEKAASYYEKAILLQDTSGIESSAFDASVALRTGRAKTAAAYFSEIGSQVAAGLAYLKLGDLMLERRNYPFAQRQYDKALNEFSISGSIEGISRANLMLAETHLNMGKTMESYDFLETARTNTRQAETLWQIEFLLGQLEERAGRNKKAIDAYKASITIIEEIRGNLTIDELKSVYVNDKIKVYDRLINLLMQEGDAEGAFNFSERARARAFLDLIGNKKIAIHNNENKELADEEQDLRMQILALSKMLHKDDLGTGKRISRAEVEKDLLVTRSKYTNLIHRLKLAAPEYASMVTVAPPELHKLQSLVDNQSAFVVYWIGEQNSFVWLLKKDKIISKEITYSEEDMMNITIDCRNAIRKNSAFKSEDFRSASNLSIQTLRDGYQMLLAPLEKELSSVETLGIVPHKVLHFLPFQALLSSDNMFLIEKHPVFYTPSLSTIFTMQDRSKDYGDNTLGMALGNLSLGGFSGLPGTKSELESIHSILPDMVSRYEEKSTESYFKENASKYAYIHLASHGFMDQKQAMYSFVLFNPTEADDGYLTVNEIFEMSINAELVVLSACQTGLGELSEGDEVVGLSRAILYAGSKNTIVSLWSVADSHTAFLMSEFYGFLMEHSMTEALHMAQMATLKKYKSPLFWAPFQLIGSGDIKP